MLFSGRLGFGSVQFKSVEYQVGSISDQVDIGSGQYSVHRLFRVSVQFTSVTFGSVRVQFNSIQISDYANIISAQFEFGFNLGQTINIRLYEELGLININLFIFISYDF